MNKQTVSIILPSYNEATTLEGSINKIFSCINLLDNYDFNIVVVNDGSKDNTDEVIRNNFPNVHLVSYTPNKGKGNAVREGLSYSVNTINCDFILFMDVDLSTDLINISKTLTKLNEGCPFVITSRYDKESNILVKQPFIRRFISKLSRIIIALMFNFKVKDTQCGFKAMNNSLAKLLIEKSLINDFSFDVEYLYIARLNGYKYQSIPVIWKDDRESKVYPLKSSIKFFGDLFKIKRNKKKYINNF